MTSLPPALRRNGEGFVCQSTLERGGFFFTTSPSHNTSTGPMSFSGGIPSLSHNTSTYPRSLPGGGYPIQSQIGGYPIKDTQAVDYPSYERMGYPPPHPGQGGYPPSRTSTPPPLKEQVVISRGRTVLFESRD